MFCTSLRRRASFSAAVPLLRSDASLRLRGTLLLPLMHENITLSQMAETQLDTHDIAMSLPNAGDACSHGADSLQQLRILLLSPLATDSSRVDSTTQRIQRFASLTGGQNLALVFLLSAPAAINFVSAKQMVDAAEQNAAEDPSGVIAYTKLQATLTDRTDIPHIPLLLLSKIGGLPGLLRSHHARICQPRPPKVQVNPVSPFQLLQLCTANPPMSQQTAFILTDLFGNLKELAAACTAVMSPPASTSPSSQTAGSTSFLAQADRLDDYESAHEKLKRLRELVGEEQCADIIDFWKEEWTVD